MHFILWIAGRLKLTAKGASASATGVVIAVAGVALAVMVMAGTLAVVVGFKNQITERLMGFEPQVSVLPAYDYEYAKSEPYLVPTPQIIQSIRAVMPQANVAQRFSLPGILKTDSAFAGVYFQAYDSAHDYKFEKSSLEEGRLPDFFASDDAMKIAISRSMAQKLGLGIGDRPFAYFFIDDAIRSRRFEIAGIYSTGFSEYDEVTAYAPISTLRRVAGVDSLSSTMLAITPPAGSDLVQKAEQLQKLMINSHQSGIDSKLYPVDNVMHTGAVFFSWLSLLDTNVVVIFILMACVAGFTLISSMFILILDKVPTIGLLRALGATRSQVRAIFATLAMKTVGLGMIIGNALAIGLLLLQHHTHWLKLDPEMYYLPYVPVEINWWWMLILNVAVVVVAWLLLIVPARLASSISPAQTMRFE